MLTQLLTVTQTHKFPLQEVVTLNAREAAPGLATRDMFGNNSHLAKQGALSVGVPGEISGYFKARDRFGNKSISWQRIFQPTIDMCRNGIRVSKTMAGKISDHDFADEGLKAMFIDPSSSQMLKEGDTYTRPVLADTLEQLAQEWKLLSRCHSQGLSQ